MTSLAAWLARVAEALTERDDLRRKRAWVLRKDGREAAIHLKAVPGIGAEIVLTVDGELWKTRLCRSHEQAEMVGAIADTRTLFEVRGEPEPMAFREGVVNCWVCDRPLKEGRNARDSLSFEAECRVCGRFRISSSLAAVLQSGEQRALRPYLSAETRQCSERGEIATLTLENFQELARRHMTTGVPSKVRRLLEVLAKQSQYPGHLLEFSEDDEYPLLDAGGPDEVRYLLRHVQTAGYVDQLGLPHSSGQILPGKALTVKGWEFVAPSGGGRAGTCFIAMSFDKKLDPALAAIEAAVREDCGFDPIRIDRVEHNNIVNDEMLAAIRSAQFLVADFTGHRAGVYFEAGFAVGLGRTVIWTCHKDDLPKAHFDTRQYSHVDWETPDDLRRGLTARIRATVQLPLLLGSRIKE